MMHPLQKKTCVGCRTYNCCLPISQTGLQGCSCGFSACSRLRTSRIPHVSRHAEDALCYGMQWSGAIFHAS